MAWEEHAEREEARYADALARMPEEPDPRQKQLVRAAMAAGGAGLARLMQGRTAEAAGWFARSAERYRESWPDAPGKLGEAHRGAQVEDPRRGLGGRRGGCPLDARTGSRRGRLADRCLCRVASPPGRGRRPGGGRARRDPPGRGRGCVPGSRRGSHCRSRSRGRGSLCGRLRDGACLLEDRDAYLEDIPVADTVIVLEALAERRGMATRPSSVLLPD